MSLLFVLTVAGLSGVMILCALKLQRSFRLLEKRTELFVCVKESEGETIRYLKLMGQTNWGIKNLNQVKSLALILPGLGAVAGSAEKVKKVLVIRQNLGLVAYLKKVAALKSKGCPLDPRMAKTPFVLSGFGLARETDDTAKLRTQRWSHHYVSLPYALTVTWDARGFEALRPAIVRVSSESAGRLSSILSSY